MYSHLEVVEVEGKQIKCEGLVDKGHKQKYYRWCLPLKGALELTEDVINCLSEFKCNRDKPVSGFKMISKKCNKKI